MPSACDDARDDNDHTQRGYLSSMETMLGPKNEEEPELCPTASSESFCSRKPVEVYDETIGKISASAKIPYGFTKTLTNIFLQGCSNCVVSQNENAVNDISTHDKKAYISQANDSKKPQNRSQISSVKRHDRLQRMIYNTSISRKSKSPSTNLNGRSGEKAVIHSFDEALYLSRESRNHNHLKNSGREAAFLQDNRGCGIYPNTDEIRENFPFEDSMGIEVCYDRDPMSSIYCVGNKQLINISSSTFNDNLSNSFKGNSIDGGNSELMYDSDPGDLKRSRNRVSKGKSLSNSKRATRLVDYDESAFDSKSVVTAGKSVADSLTTLSIMKEVKSDLFMNSDRVLEYVVEFMNKRMVFIWHLQVGTGGTEGRKERDLTKNVKMWIELGSVLRDQVIHPKLCWMAQESTCKWHKRLSNGIMRNKEKKREEIGKVNSIDLLDITSVLEGENLSRDCYPFAMKSRSMVIAVNQTRNVFESSSRKERDRIIFSLKLLISHFGAGIVAKNDEVFDQYFNPLNAQVPGRSPFGVDSSSFYEC